MASMLTKNIQKAKSNLTYLKGNICIPPNSFRFILSSGVQVHLEFGQKTEMVRGEYVIRKALQRPQDLFWEEGERTDQLQAASCDATSSWEEKERSTYHKRLRRVKSVSDCPNAVVRHPHTLLICGRDASWAVKDVVYGCSHLRVQSCDFWTARARKDMLVDWLQV